VPVAAPNVNSWGCRGHRRQHFEVCTGESWNQFLLLGSTLKFAGLRGERWIPVPLPPPIDLPKFSLTRWAMQLERKTYFITSWHSGTARAFEMCSPLEKRGCGRGWQDCQRRAGDVRFRSKSGSVLLAVSISGFDRCCRKTIFLIRPRKIDSRSGANAQR
jgi:hypothetical protein